MKQSKTKEENPVILNLFSPTNFGEYKFVPVVPFNATGMTTPFVGARFEEINLHLEGEHPNRWRRVINGISLDNSGEYSQKLTLSKTGEVHPSIVEEIKRCRTFIKAIRSIDNEEKYKAITTRDYTKDMKDTVRHRSYTMWYGYVMSAINMKGDTLNDYQGKLCLMIAPHSLMTKLIRQMEEFTMLLPVKRREVMKNLMKGKNECSGHCLRLSLTGPGRKDSSLSPIFNDSDECAEGPCKLIDEKVYESLRNPVTYFAGGSGDNLYNTIDVKRVIGTLNERVAMYI